ncbi:hypothetical protein [Pseudomonas tohonis]|uniref:hypothetical protein n=1 Tax=Pseudomonas tohonis TaxID=2725477 RepID=UPI001F2EF072|nr:hypothetical protein [Pseudomonas tohonis]
MRVSVTIQGEKLAKARLAAIGRELEPDLRGAMNTTIRWARRDVYIKELRKLFPDRGFLMQRMKVKLAGTRRLNARLIPSSSSVYVADREGWSWRAVPGHRNRARIYVPDLMGHKLAAGFVNGQSQSRTPLATRSSRERVLKKPARVAGSHYVYPTGLGPAMGPSVAYYFKRLSTLQRIRRINARLQNELERRVRRRELAARR